jgi:hypothetical protein
MSPRSFLAPMAGVAIIAAAAVADAQPRRVQVGTLWLFGFGWHRLNRCVAAQCELQLPAR